MKNYCIFFLCLALFSSCSHDFNGPYEKLMAPVIEAKNANPYMTFDGDVEPPLPNSKENNKTVLGVDVNRNGVRDDVEIFINRTHSDTNVRMALKQYVRADAEFLNSANLRNFNVTMEAVMKYDKALACLQFVLPFYKSEVRENVSTILNNEKFRDDAFGKSQSILGPKSSPGISSGEYLNYDKYCEFKINDYEKTRVHFFKVWGRDKKDAVNENK